MHAFIRILALTLLVLSTNIAHAIIQPERGSFAFSGEYLYFHPLYNQSYFVIDNATNPDLTAINGTEIDNPLNYHSGYRLEGIYSFCNWCADLDVRWTQLNSSNTRTITGPFLSSLTTSFTRVLTYRGSASSNIDVKFNALDVLFGNVLYNSCCFDFKLQGGLNYSYIKLSDQREFIGQTPVFTVHDSIKSKFWGIGPEIAMNVRYQLPSCLSRGFLPLNLVGNARGALLAGECETSYSSSSVPGTVFSLNTENKWMVIPMWDVRCGLSTEMCFNCISANLEIGFEALQYQQVIQTQNVIFETGLVNQFDNLGFYGPYVALGFSF